MLRRTFFKSLFASVAGVAAVTSVATTARASSGKQCVAYHLADMDKVKFVLGNIRNHIDGVGGPDKVEIVLVVHGPALKAFHNTADADAAVVERQMSLRDQGVAFNACGNTMRAQKVELEGLLEGFTRVDQGGVVRLSELQADGYLYLRP